MHLKKTKQANGRIYLAIIESYRRPSDKKPATRTVLPCGYLDELEKQYNDPIAHFENIKDEMTREKREANAPVSIEINKNEKMEFDIKYSVNLGCAIPLTVYNTLGIEQILRNQAAQSRIKYDLNAVMRLLVTERILNPGSKISAYENRGRYLFRTKFSKDNLFNSLDVFAQLKDRIIRKMNKSIDEHFDRDTRNIFYDVTNYHFECDPDDFRKKGVSKNHMPNPIVQMGLMQDSNAIPMNYRLFPGNTNDSQTMLPVLADMKKELKIHSATAVADKGLNCSTNMAALIASGDGFIFSQSIRGTKSDTELRNKVLDERGYRYSADKKFKKKSWLGTKTIHLKPEDTFDGKAKDVEIEVKYVAFWSEKYEQRAKTQREKVLAKSIEMLNSPGKYTSASHYGASKYVKGLNIDRKTGEVLSGAKKCVLDFDKIAEEEAADGYYLIVTSRTSWSDSKIIDAYRGLWQIEETFRISKSDIETRPVYVRKENRIEAHFLTCYIALTIIRLIQFMNKDRPSAKEIIDNLNSINCVNFHTNYWCLENRTKLGDQLFKLANLDIPKRFMTTKEIKKFMSKK